MATSFALSVGAQAAPSALNATLRCPAAGPHSACLPVTLWRDAGGIFPDISFPSTGPQYVSLWGRLNGGAQAAFKLKVDWERVSQPEDKQDPAISYLGRSSDNNPIILTDRGAFEITSAGIDVSDSDFHLIDARRWRVFDRLLNLNYGEFVFTSAKRIGVWDDTRRLCITAPTRIPGLLRVAPMHCAARPTPIPETAQQSPLTPQQAFRQIVTGLIGVDPNPPPPGDPDVIVAERQMLRGLELGNLVPERTTLRQVQRALPGAANEEMGWLDDEATRWGGMGVGIDVFRIKGSNVLVIDYSNDPC